MTDGSVDDMVGMLPIRISPHAPLHNVSMALRLKLPVASVMSRVRLLPISGVKESLYHRVGICVETGMKANCAW